jgi:hypothetical protein
MTGGTAICFQEGGVRAAKLQSSMIERIDYEDEALTLGITFRDSGRYLYFEVPRTIYDGLRAAGSAGGYFNSVVKGRFRCIPDPARRRFRPGA